MLTRRNALLIPGVLALAACQPPNLDVKVRVTATTLQISAFERGSALLDIFPSLAPLAGITVSVWDTGPAKKIWEASAATQCDRSVRRIRYGVLPAGFEERSPPLPLISGIIYSVDVEECGSLRRPGFTWFKIVDNRVEEVRWADVPQ